MLSTGTRLGIYEIVAPIGAGGMGEVYEAHDTRLGRTVALKVIRSELLEQDSGSQRFEREARLLASLNHPRIAAIHGFEESGGTRFLVLEYVPGPTMAERFKRGPLPVREAMLVGQQIAEVLQAAHARGIIHRDLKPANIKLSDDGKVKVLDFGLAKSLAKSIDQRPGAGADDSSAAMTQELTREMTGLGTPAYMSPEQACGKELDSRTDIWSFGCVLYEALTARPAFRGATATEILSAVLEREPDWQALPAATPAAVQVLLRRCLRKDPNSRLRDIGDARIELEDALAAPRSSDSKPAAITRRTLIGALAGATAGAAATGIFAVSRWRGAAPRKLTQIAIATPETGVFVPSFASRIGISPDGTRIGFNTIVPGAQTFYLRSLAELEAKRIKEINGGSAFFSPDLHWFGYLTPGNQTIYKMALTGGAPVALCTVDNFNGATWADNDVIYLVDACPGGLMSIPAAGGKPKVVAAIDFEKGERLHKFPCALPGSRAVLMTVSTADTATFDDARIVAVSTETGRKKTLVEGGTHPRYSPSGHLLYARDGKILAVRFDASRLELRGQPFTVLEGVLMSRNTGAANFDVSASGDLAYVPGVCDGGARTLVWVNRNGTAEPVSLAPKSYLHPRLSPDGRRLAIEVEGPSHDLYVYDFDRGVLANITTDGVSHWPVWSPDGIEIAYRSGPMMHFTMWRVPADRSRGPQQLPGVGVMQNAESWSPDGRTIAYTTQAPGIPPSIMVAHLDAERHADLFDKEKAPEGSPKFSPDGHWLAYCSNESGKPQVYAQAFPGPGAKIQVSNDGGTDPVWRRDGTEIYYRNGDSMMAVPVAIRGALSLGRPQELWKGRYSHGMSSSCGMPGATSSNYDVTADGKRFLMIRDEDQDKATSRQIVIVQGWADELSHLPGKA